MDLNTFRGKTVCFKSLVLPLLPRMIYGLYYNTVIVNGCSHSYLFEAFSEHILHRLKINEEPLRNSNKLRITFLSRMTKYRQVLNEDELINAISELDVYNVNKVVYER